MGFLDKFKSKAAASTNKFSGRLDALQAVCASAAIAAAADGTVADKELDKATASINSMPALKDNFPQSQIDQTLDTMLKRAAGGRMGIRGLFKEIEDVKNDAEFAEACIYVALDVADDGGIGSEEMAAVTKIADALGLDLKKFL